MDLTYSSDALPSVMAVTSSSVMPALSSSIVLCTSGRGFEPFSSSIRTYASACRRSSWLLVLGLFDLVASRYSSLSQPPASTPFMFASM